MTGTEVISAQDAARLLTLVAPGYFAYAGYCYQLPQRDRQDLSALVASVAFSLPLLAGAQAIASDVHIEPNPATVPFVFLLLGGSLLVGYLLALSRRSQLARGMLAALGVRSDPEQTVLVRTVQRMRDRSAQVTVTFKDGRVLAGTPKHATSDPDATEPELYLDHTRWWSKDASQWTNVRTQGGVLVRLSEVQTIELDSDPG